MYPQPTNFRFYQDAAKFLLILGLVGETAAEAGLSFLLRNVGGDALCAIIIVLLHSSAFIGTIYSFVILYRDNVSPHARTRPALPLVSVCSCVFITTRIAQK